MNAALHDAAAALRRLTANGQQDAARVLTERCGQVRQLMEAAADSPLTGADAAAAGECAFLLSASLRGQRDPGLANRLFQTLAAMGRMGRMQAVQHVQARTLPLSQVSALVQTLRGRDFLALLNDLLVECPAEDRQLAAWLRGLLPGPGKVDAREAMLFLKTLAPSQGGEGLPLARPLREALLGAGLADSLALALAGNPGPSQEEILLPAAEALASPAVQAEALAHALRAAGTEGPNRLPSLLAAPPDLEPRDEALLMEMRRMALRPDAPAQLLGAAQTEPEMLGLVLADLLAGGGPKAASALRLLPLLPRLGLVSALGALAPEAQAQVRARLLAVLAVLEPDLLRRAAKTFGAQAGLSGQSAQAVVELLRSGISAGASSPFNAQDWNLPPPEPRKPATRRTPLAEALRHSPAVLKDQALSHSPLAGAALDTLTMTGCDLVHCRFSGVSFRNVRLSSCSLAGCVFEDCSFQSCTFAATDMCGCVLSSCRVRDCSLEGCDLSRAGVENSAILDCDLSDCCLAGARLRKTRLESASLRACVLSGAWFTECALSRVGLQRCDFCGALLERCACRGLEFDGSSLAHARVAACECTQMRLWRSPSQGLAMLGGHTDSHRLVQACFATRSLRLDAAGVHDAVPDPELLHGPGATFATLCVEASLRVDEARRTLCAMRGQDHRRHELALERLSEEQGRILALLPVLLACPVFERARGLEGVPACAVAGRPSLGLPRREQRALLERLFPGQALPASAKDLREPVLLLEAVYAIGSLGSVAQRAHSDVDCWVCVRPGPACPEDGFETAREGLARKLSALEAWLWEQFGLETHFFPMTMQAVRQNDFGMSDKESSGSAQAALLKEEFYRTALKLAGRDLLWWAAPPEATQEEALALLEEITLLAPRTAAELVDLGQPRPIPPQEYFGACLWQIVKALHSPYKSVMKLGLLEKYAGQGESTRLLCDRIKEAVLRGRRLAEDVDPYLSLFTSIRKHYRQQGADASLALIGECLRLKADVAPEDLPAEFHTPALPQGDGQGGGAFGAALRLGVLVNQFMISAYRRIQEGLRAHKGSAQISPQDLTRLGRRIAANFAQHPHKLGLVPFLSDDIAFTELYFYAEKAPGKRTVWGVKGKDKNVGKAPVEALPPLRRDTDVVRLIAWILFNGLYDPRQAIHAERSLAPIALLDLQGLLADLLAFFPPRATLEPELDEYLKHERVCRAYLIANLPVPTDKTKILNVSVLYATNWGEVFCQSFDNPALTLQKNPLAFLRESLAKPVDAETELRSFMPKKSAAPKIRII